MRKIILIDKRRISPFNEPARALRVLNKPLWLHQRDVLAPYTSQERPVKSFEEIRPDKVEMVVYRENLFFDQYFIEEFITRARKLAKACQVAFPLNDGAISRHAFPLQNTIRREDHCYVTDMWYFPQGVEDTVQPLLIDTEPYEMGYYSIPTHMSNSMGDMVYQVPTKAFLAVESWVHILLANVIFGVFSEAARMDKRFGKSLGLQLKVFLQALLEQKQVLSTSTMVKIGQNCSIDPSAIIRGPTVIGDNVDIGPGVVIDNCLIGNNVTISDSCELMLSVVSDRCFLPFRAALFETVLMENTMVAQNTCLQLSCVGRESFVGAGTTFTDFNVIPKPLRALHWDQLELCGMSVLGSCVGHHCRVGSGVLVYPARTIESDSVVVATPDDWVVRKDVTYKDSAVHRISGTLGFHPRNYPPKDEEESNTEKH